MKLTHSLFAAATSLVLLALTSPLATSLAQTAISTAARYHPAPGPVLGAGLPALAAGGIGYGIYWLVKRRRRKTHV